jgi:hypothetical protein
MIVDDILRGELHSIAEHYMEVHLEILNKMTAANEHTENLINQMLVYVAWYKLFTSTLNDD